MMPGLNVGMLALRIQSTIPECANFMDRWNSNANWTWQYIHIKYVSGLSRGFNW